MICMQVGGVQGDVGVGDEPPQEEEPPLDFADILRYLNSNILRYLNSSHHRKRSDHWTSLTF